MKEEEDEDLLPPVVPRFIRYTQLQTKCSFLKNSKVCDAQSRVKIQNTTRLSLFYSYFTLLYVQTIT